jgi:plasmid stabilization system protein ParE
VTVRFLEIAEIELDQAIQWYDAQAPGLGNAFLIEILSATDRIARLPQAWHPLDKDLRRCRLNRFPYGLIYAVENGDIVVLAVAHLHRRPEYWRDRLKR